MRKVKNDDNTHLSVKNPLSTISNCAYIIAGALALGVNPVMGFFVILLGIASTGFHWTRSDAWHKHDIVAIYFVFAVCGGQLWLGDLGIALGFIAAAAGQWWFHFAPAIGRNRKTSLYIGISGGIALAGYAIQNPIPSTLNVITFFAIAFVMKLIADSKHDEFSRHYDYYHSAWHIATGAGIYFLIT